MERPKLLFYNTFTIDALEQYETGKMVHPSDFCLYPLHRGPGDFPFSVYLLVHRNQRRLKSVIARYRLDANQFFEAQTWVVILSLSLLVAVILAGILIIFIYNLKTLQLYRLQHTFINNFTHELKTPVTSLKLYLETFAKHELPREEQLRYIRFMLQDTERLSGNINSILNLARIESRLSGRGIDTGRSC